MKKTLKGMTLMEVIVSLFVYALLGLLLMEIMSVVNTTMTSTNQLNERLSFEAKFADNQIVSRATQGAGGTLNITYGVSADAGNGNRQYTPAGTIGQAPGETPQVTRFNEYTARYTNPNLNGAVDYSENINFRFITYTTQAREDQWLGFAFNMHLMIVPFLNRDGLSDAEKEQAQERATNFMRLIDRIEVTALDNNTPQGNHLIDEESMPTDPADQTVPVYWPQNTRRFELSQNQIEGLVNMWDGDHNRWNPNGTPTLDFAIENLTAQSGETRIQVSNDPRFPEESGGNGYNVVVSFIDEDTIDTQTNEALVRLAVTIPRVYMYVRRGTTESYYNNSMAIIDLNIVRSPSPTPLSQDELNNGIIVCRSNSTGFFDLSDYDQ